MDTDIRLKADQRRHPRWRVWGPEGRIAPNHAASFLNISQGGALIEHLHPFRPGSLLFLTILVHETELRLKCRVVRSEVQSYEVWPTGKKEHVYQTGLQFLGLSEDSRGLISEYIGSLKEEDKATQCS
ncbi:MAG: PilZ domain-containing protein [Candidatus Methylomirabilales bacterium]